MVLSIEECYDLDSAALDALLEFDSILRQGGRLVFYARVHDHCRDVLAAGKANAVLANSSYSVDDAVQAAKQAIANPP